MVDKGGCKRWCPFFGSAARSQPVSLSSWIQLLPNCSFIASTFQVESHTSGSSNKRKFDSSDLTTDISANSTSSGGSTNQPNHMATVDNSNHQSLAVTIDVFYDYSNPSRSAMHSIRSRSPLEDDGSHFRHRIKSLASRDFSLNFSVLF